MTGEANLTLLLDCVDTAVCGGVSGTGARDVCSVESAEFGIWIEMLGGRVLRGVGSLLSRLSSGPGVSVRLLGAEMSP